MEKALLYTHSEASHIKILPISLWKDDFDQENYSHVKNFEYSDILGRWIEGDVLLLDKIKVAALFFSDGTVWDTHVGWRKPDLCDKEFVNKIYEELTDAAAKTVHP